MSSETQRLVGELLVSSSVSVGSSSLSSTQGDKQLLPAGNKEKSVSVLEIDSAKERLNTELKAKQEKMKVGIVGIVNSLISIHEIRYFSNL